MTSKDDFNQTSVETHIETEATKESIEHSPAPEYNLRPDGEWYGAEAVDREAFKNRQQAVDQQFEPYRENNTAPEVTASIEDPLEPEPLDKVIQEQKDLDRQIAEQEAYEEAFKEEYRRCAAILQSH